MSAPLCCKIRSMPARSMGAEFDDQRDYSGVDAEDQPIGFLALVVAHQHPARVAGQIGHVGALLIEDQVEAGVEGIPPLLQRPDLGVAAGYLERDGSRGKGGSWATSTF